jgi:uncharacterized 2Fe-2S/4Fe-4S cluster protein (DUF4445 family)
MSRINASANGKTEALFKAINSQTERILKRFISAHGLIKMEKLIVAGNTAMQQLFCNTNSAALGVVPFKPAFTGKRDFPGAELGLSAERVILLPSVSGFVGADIVSGLSTLPPIANGESALFIDIGTNGEIALLRNGGIFCCSTAAGPALEGAEISCGTGGVEGAVNRVQFENGKITHTALGGKKPIGICGCGLVDAISVMLRCGAVDETGALDADNPFVKNGGFLIADGVTVTARDVRQYQLAKSAIMSGIKIIVKRAGLALSDVQRVYIAGGLGFFIDKESAVKTGLLPTEFLDKIVVCGNTSLIGAAACLTNPQKIAECEKIPARCRTVELSDDPLFMDEFVENMMF